MLIKRRDLPNLPVVDWSYVLNTTTDGLYSLIVTLAVLAMFTVLLMAGRIMADNPLILTGFGLITAFWFSGAAHKWGSSFQQNQQGQAQLTDTQRAQIEQIVSTVLAKQAPVPPPLSSNGHTSS